MVSTKLSLSLWILNGVRTLKQSMIACVLSYESDRRRSNSSCPAVSHKLSSTWVLSMKISVWSVRTEYAIGAGWGRDYHVHSSLRCLLATFNLLEMCEDIPKTVGSL